MAHNKSAIKRIRQAEVRRQRNRIFKKQLATAVKNVDSAETREEAESKLNLAISLLDRAAGKNLIHRNKAANQKSRLTKAVSAL